MATAENKEVRGGNWQTVERPGYFGKRKDELVTEWNLRYGESNWRLAWELKNGAVLDFQSVFWQIYVAGYSAYFLAHPEEAHFLTDNFSFTYDKEITPKKDAFDPYALYEKPGHPNQFHHVALNIALESFLGLTFVGETPIQVREGKPGTPVEAQPAGYLWSPGRIPTVRQDLIPDGIVGWWNPGSIEDLYQSAKVVQRRVELPPQYLIYRWD